MQIQDSDIATIEALHDLLLDYHGYKLDHPTLKNARELTNRMYEDMESSVPKEKIQNSQYQFFYRRYSYIKRKCVTCGCKWNEHMSAAQANIKKCPNCGSDFTELL